LLRSKPTTEANLWHRTQTNIKPYFEEYESFTVLEKSEILQANYDLFQAINEHDLEAMKSLWLESKDTTCLKGGEESVVIGYDNIINMWSSVFTTISQNIRPVTVKETRLQFMVNMRLVLLYFVPKTRAD
jgi:hypothetical protein